VALSSGRLTVILRLAGEAGLRRAEIAQVHEKDLAEDLAGYSLTVHGKGGVIRVVPLSDDVAALVDQAMRTGDGWALPGDDGGHLSPRYVGHLAGEALGRFTLHQLRHRFATRAYAATGDLLAVQELLGHASAATTQRYVKMPDDAMRRAVLAAA
jgi:integrase